MPEEDRLSKRGWPFFRSGLGDIAEAFKEMEEMMTKQFENLSKISPEDLTREQKLPDGTQVKSWGPFVYGYSVTVGPDGKPKVTEFGNLKPETSTGKKLVDFEEKREALADVIPGENEIRVIVELPGVEKEDIKLSGKADKLTISVDANERKYYKEVELPTKVDIKKATSKYKNGVLDITIPKKKEEQTKSEPMKIE
ncbi:MAG: Hsp20/alpha crystallin family protein [Candidatus Bathyarchaeota archaeon]|nr:Hsp20/alpha crystallin family protein [Candidatus Bathyarchaeum sp.]